MSITNASTIDRGSIAAWWNLSITAKLTAIIVLVAVISLVLGVTVIVISDVRQLRSELTDRALLIATTVGNYSASDIAFGDRGAAEDTLSLLDEIPYVVNALLYDNTGLWFASYKATGHVPSMVDKTGVVFQDNAIAVTLPIDYRGERWGFIHLVVSSRELKNQIIEHILVLLLAGCALIVITYLLARRFQKIVSQPILELTSAATRIANETNYALRVSTNRSDEIGELYGAFNTMLSRIEARERERDHALMKLSESEARFAAMFNSIPDGVILANNERCIVMSNPAALEMFGYSETELHGKSTMILYANPQEFYEQGRKRFNVRHDSAPSPYEIRYRHKDGTVFWTETVGGQVKTEEGQKIGFLGIFRDITERKHNEEELARYREHLEELVAERTTALEDVNKELKAFNYSVSHDLRTPLRAIDGFSQALLEDYGGLLDETGVDYLGRVRKSAQRMGTLIDDMLRLSRVSQHELAYSKVNLSDIAQKIIKRLREESPQRRCDVVIEPGMIVSGDYGLLQILLENVLGNAWKYTSNRNDARITFSRMRGSGNDVFFVEDNGAGFDMRYVDKLFGAFQRLHKDTEFPGTGIGLAIARRVVVRHGGRIWASSQLSKKTNIYFTLAERRTTLERAERV